MQRRNFLRLSAAGAAISGGGEASAACREGLPGLFRGRLLLGRARLVWPGQRVQLHVLVDPADGDQLSIHALAVDGGGWLASHHRATRRGEWVIDPAHWDGLPDGHT